MLDDTLKAQLKAYLERVREPFEIVAALDDRPSSAELRGLLEDIAAMSDKITLKLDGDDERKPSFTLKRHGSDRSCASRRSRSAMNSLHWCWRCCGPAATRPRSSPR
jgi:alkyl hydroperoxide reductase subunit AhpF